MECAQLSQSLGLPVAYTTAVCSYHYCLTQTQIYITASVTWRHIKMGAWGVGAGRAAILEKLSQPRVIRHSVSDP